MKEKILRVLDYLLNVFVIFLGLLLMVVCGALVYMAIIENNFHWIIIALLILIVDCKIMNSFIDYLISETIFLAKIISKKLRYGKR